MNSGSIKGPMSFAEVHEKFSWDKVLASIQNRHSTDVLKSLTRAENGNCDLEDFKNFISPAAEPYLEKLAQLSHDRTVKRFGRTIQMFAPIYLSNECQNICTYCGFSAGNKVVRRTLNPTEILKEAGVLKKLGFDHVLILTGESTHVGMPYFISALDNLRPHFSSPVHGSTTLRN
jgi:2-iminoacetate synthase